VVNWAGEPAGLVWYYGHGRRIALLRESGRNGQRILGQNLRTTKGTKFGLKTSFDRERSLGWKTWLDRMLWKNKIDCQGGIEPKWKRFLNFCFSKEFESNDFSNSNQV
jgi:hypothetical protein